MSRDKATPILSPIATSIVAFAILVAACGSSDGSPAAGATGSATSPSGATSATSSPPATSPATTTSAPPPAPPSPSAFARNPAEVVEGQPYTQAIDPANFVTTVDNPYFPLKVGTIWTYGGGEDIEVRVTSDTKLILGVAATVVRDRVFVNGALEEDTFDWFAQDRQGNVWYFGEKTAEYRDGKVISTKGSWTAGVDGAQPGIVMLAQPQVGDAYRQEYYKGEAEDMAEVTAVTGKLTVREGAYSDILVTEEWTPLEPAVRERKTYGRDVGLIEARAIRSGSQVVQLEEMKQAP